MKALRILWRRLNKTKTALPFHFHRDDVTRQMVFLKIISFRMATGQEIDEYGGTWINHHSWKSYHKPLITNYRYEVLSGRMTENVMEWLDLNVKKHWYGEGVGDPNLCLYCFEDKGTAAMFKLVWGNLPREAWQHLDPKYWRTI